MEDELFALPSQLSLVSSSKTPSLQLVCPRGGASCGGVTSWSYPLLQQQSQQQFQQQWEHNEDLEVEELQQRHHQHHHLPPYHLHRHCKAV